MRLFVFLAFMLGSLTACSHRRPNSDCRWPGETGAGPLNRATQQHLSDDAEFAEDLAIRYADVHKGLHTRYFEGLEQYGRARDGCMAVLFREVATSHKVSELEVRQSLGRRYGLFDFVVMFSFLLFYGGLAAVFTNWLYRFYGSGEHATVVIMTVVASLLVSTAALMLGEIWTGTLETFRIGNGHMSYRFGRIPWTHHRPALFIAGIIVFWLVAAYELRHSQRDKRSSSLSKKGEPESSPFLLGLNRL